MKNQYNFAAKTTTTTTANNQPATKPEPANKEDCSKQQEKKVNNSNSNNNTEASQANKTSFSRLHNLVTSKFNHQNKHQRHTSTQHQKDGRLGPMNQQQRIQGRYPPAPATKMPQGSTQQPQQQSVAARDEKITPELAKCYDEIDQIYDYIRGLAPLPLQLRKIKSIDFEQLEREKKIQQQHAATAAVAAKRSLEPAATTTSQRVGRQQQPVASSPVSVSLVAPKTQAKVRQREATDRDNEPQLPQPAISSSVAAGLRVQGPLPIKVTTTHCDNRPTVKRVESLNLGGGGDKPALMIGASQQGQMFRLPRAQSASTLNKPPGAKATPRHHLLQSLNNSSPKQLPVDAPRSSARGGQFLLSAAPEASATRTLPALRLAGRLSANDNRGGSYTLNRLRATTDESPRRPPLGLVESFVDDDDVPSVISRADAREASRSSSSSSQVIKSGKSKTSAGSSSGSSSTSHSVSGSSDGSSSSSSSSTSSGSSSTGSSEQETADSEVDGKETDRVLRSRKGSSDRWPTEKSHSDYEHDTVSSTPSDSPSANDDHVDICDDMQKRRGGGNQQGSHLTSTSSGRLTSNTSPARHSRTSSGRAKQANSHDIDNDDDDDDRLDDVHDHIYEHIPAHRNMKVISAPPVNKPFTKQTPSNNLLSPIDNKSYSQLRQQRSQQQQQQQRPFNYPVAYAPSAVVAPRQQQQQQVAYLSQSVAHPGVQRVQHMQQQRATGGTYPLPLTSSRAVAHWPATAALVHNSSQRQLHQANSRPLDHRHRQLSMGNLHLLPYLNHPLASLYHHQRQAPPVGNDDSASKLNRSSSSSRVNRIRAPRLSPGQLIAQIQMPRAVNKRQRQPPELMASNFNSSQASGSMDRRRQADAVFRWPQPQQQQHRARDGPNFDPRQQQQVAASGKNNKRNSIRRLTAIGIEQVLEGIRLAPLGVAPNRNHRAAAAAAETRRSPQAPSAHRVLALANEAPLIDGSDDEQSSGRDRLAPGKQPNRCLNSISDLRSFSSNSSAGGSSTTNAEEDSAGSQLSTSDSGDLPRRAAAPSKGNDSDAGGGNFVSSRSFIKCYYGRKSNTSADEPKEKQLARKKTEQPVETGKSNRRGSGEKLLGLIGLNTNGRNKSSDKNRALAKSSGDKKPDEELATVSSRRRQQGGEPLTPSAFLNGCKGGSQLVGEFLNSEGPILVRDRRIAALKNELVRHYEHPTVQVASVAAFSGQKKSRAAALAELTGSTNTTDSTSSYEAAIKNSRALVAASRRRHHQPAAEASSLKETLSTSTSSQQQRSAGRKSSATSGNKWIGATNKAAATTAPSGGGSSSNGAAALIKVPKLSKQSHLLNRPLPKPPQPASTAHHTPYSAGSQSSSRRTAAAMLALASAPVAAASRPPAVLAKRKLLVSTNLDASPVSSNRHPAARLFEHPPRATAPTSGKQPPAAVKSSSSSSSASKQPSGGSSSLSPSLAALTNLGTQPSPTVTNYTSSGISSRLTSGTHLAPSSNSSGQRVKSLSELHKQSKLQQQQVAAAAAATTTDLAAGKTQADEKRDTPVGLREDEEEAASSGEDDVDGKENKTKTRARTLKDVDCDDDDEGKRKTMTDNLRLFDEKFSSKFVDKQELASSNDSLLESINFSGTLNRRPVTRRLNAH